jgi:hypothetical protein
LQLKRDLLGGKVTIEDLGSLGEIIAAVATVATLGYLAIQIRQNTRATHASSVQDAGTGLVNAVSLMSQNPQNADVVHRGLFSYDDLSESEQTHFIFMISVAYSHFDAMYGAHRAGTLPPEVWEREQSLLRFYLSTPGGRRAWQVILKGLATRPFAEFAETTIRRDG